MVLPILYTQPCNATGDIVCRIDFRACPKVDSTLDAVYWLTNGAIESIKLRGTDLLGKVATEEEAMEYCGAFMQLYREEARYLERTAPWLERVGLAYVKQHIVEDEEGQGGGGGAPQLAVLGA